MTDTMASCGVLSCGPHGSISPSPLWEPRLELHLHGALPEAPELSQACGSGRRAFSISHTSSYVTLSYPARNPCVVWMTWTAPHCTPSQARFHVSCHALWGRGTAGIHQECHRCRQSDRGPAIPAALSWPMPGNPG